MNQPLAGITIAFMVANGFEETEMTEPQRSLLKAGAAIRTISTEQGLVNGWHCKGWGHFFPVDKQIGNVLGADYDMLVLPGGERSVDKLAPNPHVRRIIGHFLDAGKPIAAIDQGVGLLAIAAKLKGRSVTGAVGHRAAVEAAGGLWREEPVVVDGILITAAGIDDLASFVEQTVKIFTEASAVKKAA